MAMISKLQNNWHRFWRNYNSLLLEGCLDEDSLAANNKPSVYIIACNGLSIWFHEKIILTRRTLGTVNSYSAAIRLLLAVTLNRTLNYLQIPSQNKRKALPKVLMREEVFSIIESCKNIKHKPMLMVVYSSGLRISKAATLKIQHIDSKTMLFLCQTSDNSLYSLCVE
jgi:integrase